MTERNRTSPSDEGRAALLPLHGPRDHPAMAASLRRVALHQETASLLELRAARVATERQAALLRRRAEQHRTMAHHLRQELAAALRRPQRKAPSASKAR